MIHISADQNLYKVEELIPPQAKLNLYNPSHGLPDVNETDALLVRTVTRVNAQTLASPPKRLKFIGTGSSGTDHVDEDYLKTQGITFADANGCNARAVAEYVMTALLLWKESHQPQKDFGKVGVIGVGKAGSAVVELLQEFGIECVPYDPPREQRESGFKSAALEEVLACDMLTFHVPLTHKGEHSTHHWLDEKKLAGRNYKVVVNAARGGVIDELALMKAYVEGRVQSYVLDVWEEEPDFNTEIAKHAFIATPHIAGYSEQSKINATKMVCDELANFLGLNKAELRVDNATQAFDFEGSNIDLSEVLTRLHPIKKYHSDLRELLDDPNKASLFRDLRVERPYRFEYPHLRIPAEILDAFPNLKKLGIKSTA